MKTKIGLVGIIAVSLAFSSVKGLAAEQTKEQLIQPVVIEESVKEKDLKVIKEFDNKARDLTRKAYDDLSECDTGQYRKNYEEIISNWETFIEKYPNNFYVSSAKESIERAQKEKDKWNDKSVNEIQNYICDSHLKQLGLVLHMYAQDYNNKFPDDLKELLYPIPYISTPMIFWCPADNDPKPTDITNSTPNTVNSSQISYTYYRYPGYSTDQVSVAGIPSNKIVIMEDNTANYHNGWKHRLYLDGHVEFEKIKDNSN